MPESSSTIVPATGSKLRAHGIWFPTCLIAILLVVQFGHQSGFAQPTTGTANLDIRPLLDACNVSWDVPGPTSAQSMPIGNGDLGLNVWTETNGDVVFYIGKTDAWNEDVRADNGLMKVGKVRISVKPAALTDGAAFTQVLKLHDGEIQVQEGAGVSAVHLRIWVDANHPIIRVEASSQDHPISVQATLENWRTTGNNPDVILDGQTNRVVWSHRNGANADPHVANLTFGAIMKGPGFASQDDMNLQTTSAAKHQTLSIYPLTATTATRDEWQSQLERQVAELEGLDLERTRTAHQAWWDQFWHRSWVYVNGDEDAAKVTRGYVLQRFVTACAGRGAYPIKFNGSLFVVDVPAQAGGQGNNARGARAMNADTRSWGGQYWFQNTRPMYWPRLAAGDFDMMQPLFKMYSAQIAPDAVQIKGYYNHEGAYFAETAPFWGSVRFMGPEVKEDWTGHYFTPILELSMMMFDYYEFTGDKNFAKETMLPMATAGLTFFNQHFKRDDQGKILLDPDNSIEQFWKVHNPAPDIGALHAILQRVLALPDDMLGAADRAGWEKMLKELPELPTGTAANGKKVLLPYTGEQTARPRNSENPELYAIYPFRLYGLGKPDLQLAVDTFQARKQRAKGCWVQDPIQAAMLGLPDVAKSYMLYNFTDKEPRLKFPAFWARRNDYPPDEDNGGNGEHALQQMLVQTDGRKILLLPAWPAGWNAEFKLNAPFQTTVQGSIRDGALVNLLVTPAERRADVIDMTRADKR